MQKLTRQFILAALLASGSAAYGQTSITWSATPTDGEWGNAVNWSPADVPDANTEVALFASSSFTDLNLSAATTVKKLTFLANSGNYVLSGSPLTVDVADPTSGNTVIGVQLDAGVGDITVNNFLDANDAGGGNNSSIQIFAGAGRTLNLAGGASSATGNRNMSFGGDGVVNIFTSLTTGTAQLQHNANATVNLHVNPSATNQIRSFSNGGGGVRIQANVTRALGLGVTGATSHVGRIFLAKDGITTTGTLSTTGATIAGPHTMDVTFGADIPGAGTATHSGSFVLNALSGTALTAGGTSATIHLDVGEDDTLLMTGVLSGFPTGYTLPVMLKQGPGTATLSGANTSAIPMTVAAGSLNLTPAHTGGGLLIVSDGAVLGVNLSTPGSTLVTSGLTTVPTTTKATVSLNLGATGLPTAPVIQAATLNPTGPTAIRLTGNLSLTSGSPVPVLGYGTLTGLGFPAFSLELPFRMQGNLIHDIANSRILAEITSINYPAWRGSVNSDWDIDSIGDGSTGTANWQGSSGPNTYVQDAPVGTDGVLFDDSATGSTLVNLTTKLTPAAVVVANAVKNYAFSGSGYLGGNVGIQKSGAGQLIIANTAMNLNTGTNLIDGGVLKIGTGIAGEGSLGGPVQINAGGTLEVDRPDGTTLTSVNGDGSWQINAGAAVRLTGGGTFSGSLSGQGDLKVEGSNFLITGDAPNSFMGLAIVSQGQLQLGKSLTNSALGGNVLITGTGTLALQAPDQIVDSATITFTGTSTDAVPTQAAGGETIANVIVNPSVATGQFIMRQGMTVTDTAEVRNGILSIASAHTANVGKLRLFPGGIVRIAANTGPSTLNVGGGGIEASGGEVQVKFNTNAQDGVLNLHGDVHTTGDFAFTNAGFTGASLNVVNLEGDRIFDIGTGTATSVACDLGGAGGLTKSGGGTLALTDACSAGHLGATTVLAGEMLVNGTVTNSTVTVESGATLSGGGRLQVGASVRSGGIFSPGVAGVGEFAVDGDLQLATGSFWQVQISGAATQDKVVVGGTLTASSSILVQLSGYAPVLGDSFDLADAAAISGTPAFDFSAAPLTEGLTWDTSEFSTSGIVKVTTAGTAYDAWAADQGLAGANALPSADPDHDGIENLIEFATNSSASSGLNQSRTFANIHTLGGQSVLTFTAATRKGAVFSAEASRQKAVIDGLTYQVEGTSDPASSWGTISVTELSPADSMAVQAAESLPTLEANWEWHSFRAAGLTTDTAKVFLRLRVQ